MGEVVGEGGWGCCLGGFGGVEGEGEGVTEGERTGRGMLRRSAGGGIWERDLAHGMKLGVRK